MSHHKRRNNNKERADILEDEGGPPPLPEEEYSENEEGEEDLLSMDIQPMPETFMQKDGDRMVISHIEVDNFKSYFGKQLIGPFHKSFTSIIGPNGSGKSNVIDALLFVFGYRASKIRSKKLSVLIHSSAGRDNIQSCTVAVHFCKIVDINEKEYRKTEGSDIAISRTAYKDSTSRYTMNGRTVKFKEVGDLLRRNGVDLVHNRFLILQGEVEQISMMKPKAEKEEEEGMLEYLEDIIGSSRLKIPINKLSKRIEKIDDQRAIQLQRLQHAEKEKLQLDGPAREMLRHMRIENAINCITNRILLARRYENSGKMDDLKSRSEQLEKELMEAQNKLAEIIAQSKQLSKERQKLQNQLDKSHEAIQATEQRIGELKQFKAKSGNDIKRLESKKEKLNTDLENEEKKLVEWESAPEKAKEKIEKYRKQLAEAETTIDECSPILIQKLGEVQERMEKETQAKTQLESQLSKLSVVEDELNSKLTLAQEKLLNLRREEDAQRRKYDELRNKLLDVEEQIGKQEKNLQTSNEALPELEQTYEGKMVRMGTLREKEAKLANRLRELRAQYEEKRQSEEQWKSSNKVLNRLMQAKQSGEIAGIFGRLGDLGAIDQKYDAAISTTCGALDNIVVENVDAAQRCIELLKQDRLGQATLIALDKQQHLWNSIRQKPKTPENAPRLFDLITVADENVLPAFYYAVRDTLVADNIAAATRIGLNSGRRWRTVTLNGELIEPSGAMTGGGRGPTTGKIGREVRVNTGQSQQDDRGGNLADLEQQMSNAEAELTGIRRECGQLETELQRRQEQLNKMRGTLRDAELNREHLSSTLKTLQKQIETQKRKVVESTADQEEVRQNELEVENIRAESAKMAEKTNSLRTQIMEINDKIEEATDRIAGPVQKRIKEAEGKKKEGEAGINSENALLASSERNVKKIRVKLTNLEQDIKDAERQLEAVQERLSDTENQLGGLDEILNQRKTELETAKTALNEFMASIGERNEEELELQKRTDELKRELKEMNNEISNLDGKIKMIDSKISKLKYYRTKWLIDTLSKETERVINPKEKQSNANKNRAENGEEEDEEGSGDENGAESEELDGDNGMEETNRRRVSGENLVEDDDLDQYLVDLVENNDAHRERLVDDDEEDEDEQMEIDEREDEQDSEEDEADAAENRQQDVRRRRTPVAPLNFSNRNQFFMPAPNLSEQFVRDEVDLDQLEEQLAELERRKVKQAAINLTLIQDYLAKVERYEAEFNELAVVTEQRDKHRAFHDRLKKQRLHEFMEGFQQIATELRITYQMITIQGDVSLELVDSLDPFAEGIAFNVRPPKKSWKQITNLSGGEKTLASLSLVFGLHKYKPTPLYVMDEIDAALDFRNVAIIGNYLLERTRNAQFVVISLRNQMYEKADRLIGIYKVKDCTHNVVIDPRAMKRTFKEDRKKMKRLSKTSENSLLHNVEGSIRNA